ncbi:hypothetical protein GOP47_0025705 [Adiantum capillus-veneris]|uniref:BFN domain-containing protein n=1 Tax=Adiantum capillus-veneris TaxID=13818 RepID=A0A9D4U381_ADICA|nr:hypothetical protein GOP47_0025705 [Adiantum capillus-veneris]
MDSLLSSSSSSCQPSLDFSCGRRFCALSASSSGRNLLFPGRTNSFSFSLPSHRSARFPCIRCCSSSQDSSSSSSSSNAAGGWDNDDCNYLEAQVVDAVSLLPSQGHLYMTLSDGGEVEVDHVKPPKRPLLFRSRNPSIFLKIVSEPDLILPIIVRDSAIDMLMSALHGEEKVLRPNQYHIMRDLVGNLDFEVRMVRITERINDTYISRIYVGKPGHKEMQSVDARPSDAVNLAVRCKAPIYVHKDLVASDAVKPVVVSSQATDMAINSNSGDNLDIPSDGEDLVAEEMTLVKSMHLAIVEERYADAARWRDELNSFRSKRLTMKEQILTVEFFTLPSLMRQHGHSLEERLQIFHERQPKIFHFRRETPNFPRKPA